MSKKLSGKTAIVTGAGSGMGRAIATLFAEEGANVVVADINNETVDEVVSEIKNNGNNAVGVVANVAKQEDIDNMVKTATDNFGSLDILVNNAGIMDNFMPVGEVTDELWERVLSINLTGPFRAARAAIKVMEKQDNGGVIINNASVGGLFGSPGGATYVTSKHGLIGLTRNIGVTYGNLGKIRCNAIAPGAIETNIGNTITAPNEMGYKALATFGASSHAPSGSPMQVARVALFLASDESNFVNGEVIRVDGGWKIG